MLCGGAQVGLVIWALKSPVGGFMVWASKLGAKGFPSLGLKTEGCGRVRCVGQH